MSVLRVTAQVSTTMARHLLPCAVVEPSCPSGQAASAVYSMLKRLKVHEQFTLRPVPFDPSDAKR